MLHLSRLLAAVAVTFAIGSTSCGFDGDPDSSTGSASNGTTSSASSSGATGGAGGGAQGGGGQGGVAQGGGGAGATGAGGGEGGGAPQTSQEICDGIEANAMNCWNPEVEQKCIHCYDMCGLQCGTVKTCPLDFECP